MADARNLAPPLLDGLFPAALRYGGTLGGLTVRGGSGGNVFTMTGIDAPATLLAGTGNDQVSVGSTLAPLTIDGQAVPQASSIGAHGYTFSATQLAVCGYKFCRGAQNVVVEYTAGYATAPPDIAQACIELVALRYRERTRIG